MFKNLFLSCVSSQVLKIKENNCWKLSNLKLFHILNLFCISIDQNTNNGSTSSCNTFFLQKNQRICSFTLGMWMTFKHYLSRWNVELGINSHTVHACICVDVCQCVCVVLVVVVDGPRHMHVCPCAQEFVCVCVYIAYIYVYIHVCIHVHTYILIYVYECMHLSAFVSALGSWVL